MDVIRTFGLPVPAPLLFTLTGTGCEGLWSAFSCKRNQGYEDPSYYSREVFPAPSIILPRRFAQPHTALLPYPIPWSG